MPVPRSRRRDREAPGRRLQRHAPAPKGLPTSLVVAIASVGFVLFAFLAYHFLAQSGKKTTLKRARTLAEIREFDDALAVLATIPRDGSAIARDAASIEAQIRAELDRIDRDRKEVEGERWWGRYIENFQEKGLQKISAPAVRVFVERCDEFLKSYPGHGRTSWVQEKRATYAAMVDLSKPLGWEDVEYRAILARTREEFGDAMRLVRDFLGGGSLTEKETADARDLLERLENGARAFFDRKWKEMEDHLARGRQREAAGLLLAVEDRIGIDELREKARRERERIEAILRGKG